MSVCFAGRATAASAGLISDAGALSKFTAAAEAYKAEDYDKAAAAYEEILRGGKESGALYYNLGNSYFKKGSLGKAVLNYERARRLIPRDGDLDFNLEYARQLAPTPTEGGVGVPTPDVSGRDGGIEPASSQSVILTGEVSPRLWRGGQRIRNWTDRELAWALCGLALLLAAAHVSSLYGRWPRRSRRGVAGSLCVLWLLCTGGFVAKLSAETDLAVAVAGTEAKFEPREDATTHFRVTQGTQAKILQVEDSWAKIRRADGKAGWVPEKVFERF
jgi:tetratricopeptide (TPR) repeat protein